MKRGRFLLLTMSVLAVVYLGYPRRVDRRYEIGTWPGFRAAAISYTFDDCCSNQLEVGVPMFNEFGFKMTLYVITGMSPDWAALRKAAEKGHEIGSHSVTHPRFDRLSRQEQEAEWKNSQEQINAQIPGRPCLTLAYPYGAVSNPRLCDQLYIAARASKNVSEKSTPADLMSVGSVVCGAKGRVQTLADFRSQCDEVASRKGWCVLLIHAIDDSNGYSSLSSAALRENLEYLQARRGRLWVETFGNVVRYIRERNDASVTVVATDEQQETVSVTSTLDGSIYNVPISLRRRLPAGWPSVRVTQGGQPVAAEIVTVKSARYIQFDVIPNGGAVLLSKATDTTPAAHLTAAVRTNE